MNLESAEMVKHGINAFLANSIVFANHLAEICEFQGAIIDDVVRGMKSDPRIGSKAYLAPGIGFSGGTLGRDLKVLESVNNANHGFARLFGLIHEMNAERKIAIVQRVKRILGPLKGKKIGVLGVTYKPGTSTLRRSLPLEIVELLLTDEAIVNIFDPKADYNELADSQRFTVSSSVTDALAGADMALLLTEWNDFKAIDWIKEKAVMSGAVVFDTKNFLDASRLRSIGYTYYSVGR
jgi:UDPglucose 6-dehydrogenase